MQLPRILAATALLAATHAAHALDFRPIVGYEWAELTGIVQDGPDQVSLKNDLGIDDSSSPLIGFQVGVLGQYLRFRYVPYSFSGDGTIDREIEFAGETFSASLPIRSKMELTEYAVDYRFIPINTPVGYFGAGIGVNAFEASIDLRTDTEHAHSSETVPIPTLGVTAGLTFPLTGLSVNGDFSGMSFDDNRYTNLELNLDYQIMPLVGARVGYRDRKLKIESGDLLIDTEMSGPFAALWVGF
jgi:outer membrane protein